MRKQLWLLAVWAVLQTGISQSAVPQSATLIQTVTTENGMPPHSGSPAFLSFDLNGGLIFFEAMLNGQSDTFILDTGSPDLMLNEPDIDMDSMVSAAIGVNGGLVFMTKKNVEFQMANGQQQKIQTLGADLSHLEEVKKQSFRGMVGHEVLKDHELFIDYANKKMQLLDGQQTPAGYKRTMRLPFKMQQHFVVIEAKVGSKKLKFAIDSGAEVNVLDHQLSKRFSEKILRKNKTINVRSVNKNKLGAELATLSKMFINEKKYANMPFVLMDMAHLNSGYGINLDGLLGFPFLSANVISIDYINDELCIWAREESASSSVKGLAAETSEEK